MKQYREAVHHFFATTLSDAFIRVAPGLADLLAGLPVEGEEGLVKTRRAFADAFGRAAFGDDSETERLFPVLDNCESALNSLSPSRTGRVVDAFVDAHPSALESVGADGRPFWLALCEDLDFTLVPLPEGGMEIWVTDESGDSRDLVARCGPTGAFVPPGA